MFTTTPFNLFGLIFCCESSLSIFGSNSLDWLRTDFHATILPCNPITVSSWLVSIPKILLNIFEGIISIFRILKYKLSFVLPHHFDGYPNSIVWQLRLYLGNHQSDGGE